MKRVRCPKCDNFITFDETKYKSGQRLVFQCPQCSKEFGIRIGVSNFVRHKKRKTMLLQMRNQRISMALFM